MTDQHPWDQQNVDNLEQGFDHRFSGGDPTVNPSDFVGPNAQRDYYEALERADADRRRHFEGQASQAAPSPLGLNPRQEALRELVLSIARQLPLSPGRGPGDEAVSATSVAAALAARASELPWERWKIREWVKKGLRRQAVVTDVGVLEGVAVATTDAFGDHGPAVLLGVDGSCRTGTMTTSGYNSDEPTFVVEAVTTPQDTISLRQLTRAFVMAKAGR